MKIVVMGSGVIGVTSAYALRSAGHDVTVIERRAGPALEASFANAALLTPSMSEPWNAPGCWRTLLASIGRPDAAVQVRLRGLLALGSWGRTFLRNSRAAAFERNTRANMSLALYSLQMMQRLLAGRDIEYRRQARGILKIFREPAMLERVAETSRRWAATGLRFRRLTAGEVVSLEPALDPMSAQLAGGIHYETDQSGDAYLFTVRLAEEARHLGVEFRFDTEVQRLETSAGRVTAAVCNGERLNADLFVLATGSYSAPLVRDAGIRLPVRPVKGYSITFDMQERSLSIPVVDDEIHAVVTPLGNTLRVVGMAEFAGYDLALRPARLRYLRALLLRLLPHARVDASTARPWCGLRPMSADGVPIIGPTPLANLFVNTGHGHLGWTLAAGSAHLLADLVNGQSPSLDPAPFALARFAWSR